MKSQRGGFLVGLIVGLLSGLALALAVALYIAKVPIPFLNKVPARSGERDAQEVEKNRNWDPNTPLQGRTAAKPPGPAVPIEPAPSPEPSASPADVVTAPAAPRPAEIRAEPRPDSRPPASRRDPAAILADRPGAAPSPDPSTAPPAGRSREDPFIYFIQAGAYSRTDEAEQQRAKLAMLGFEARVTEREQAGKTVYRVRVGPFTQKEQADRTKERLESASMEAALVRVQK